VPGQKKRRDRAQEAQRRLERRTAPDAGRWVVQFETQDHAEWCGYLRRLRAGPERIDPELVRLDTFCGRDEHPTTYRMSLFVPNS
jgi:hypothetical protein